MGKIIKSKNIAVAVMTVLLIGVIASGCNIAAVVSLEPTPAPPTAEELLADALKYYDAGNYEEAILLYTEVINIEPRNYDANYGLGKAYRGAGDNAQAIAPLESAYGLNSSSEVAYELGCAYIANGQYADAESVSAGAWEDGNGDAKSGALLIISLAAQDRTEEAVELMKDTRISGYLSYLGGSGGAYMGSYDENGKRSGNGVGVYADGYIYIGEYKDGGRDGHGIWLYPDGYNYFDGEWAGDAPNGEGTIYRFHDMPATQIAGYTYNRLDCYTCIFTDGIADGSCQTVWYMYGGDIHHWSFSVVNGQAGGKTVSKCSDCGAKLLGPIELAVEPWA